MSPDVYRRTTCRLCNSENLQLVLQLAATPVGDAYLPKDKLSEEQNVYPNDLFLCLDCYHAQLLDVINPDILYGNFTYKTAISLGLIEHFESYAEDVFERCRPSEESLVVDIGSNDGTLLGFFQKQGMKVLGVDPARAIAEDATARGIETLPTYFTSELAGTLKRERGAAQIITTNNTFANIDDLGDMLSGIRDLLGPDGVLVMETGYVVDQILNGVFDNIYHEHISYFCVTPLLDFLPAHGFKLFDVQKIDTKGGSIRCFIQLAEGTRPVSQAVSEIVAEEREKGFWGPEPYLVLAERIKEAGQQLETELAKLKGEGKRIAGFGASVGATTLLYEFGLDKYLDFLVDDNPVKHQTFSPGHHIPVLSPAALKERKPDFLVVLPWRYAETIMEKHWAFVEQGGNFIVPWPKLEVKKNPIDADELL